MAPKMKPIAVLLLWMSCFASANLDNNEATRAALEDSQRDFQDEMESRSAEICQWFLANETHLLRLGIVKKNKLECLFIFIG